MKFNNSFTFSCKINFKFTLIVALIIGCVLFTFLLSACQKNGNSSENNPTNAQESKQNNSGATRFLNFNPEVSSYLKNIAAKFEKETGKKIIVDTAANGQYTATLTAKMTTDEAPTLFVLDGDRQLQTWKDYVIDLSNTWAYQHQINKDMCLYGKDNKVYGIPYHMEGYGIMVNKKIINKYFDLPNRSNNISSIDEIKSFNQLKQVAEDMQARKDEIGIQGAFASTSLKAGHEFRWYTHLANVPFTYEFAERLDQDPNYDYNEVDFRYADNYKKIFDLYINNSICDRKRLGTVAVTDSMAEFALGKCAFVQNGNWSWGQINNVKGNVVSADDVQFIPIYMDMPNEENQGLCIGTENFYCINSKSSKEQQQTALDFIEWMYSSETGKESVINDLGFIAPYDTFSNDDVPANPLSAQVMQWMKDDSKVTVPWGFTLFPSQNWKNKFGASILRYSQGQKDYEVHKQFIVDLWKSETTSSLYK